MGCLFAACLHNHVTIAAEPELLTLTPCVPQDTPAAKLTYTAAITVPAPLTALMSAVPQDSSSPAAAGSGTRTFHFKQDVPIPSYLLALAVGELEYRQIGPRSKVLPLSSACPSAMPWCVTTCSQAASPSHKLKHAVATPAPGGGFFCNAFGSACELQTRPAPAVAHAATPVPS